jgi:TonB family protein
MYPASASNGSAQAPAVDPDFVSASDHAEQILKHFGFRESPFGVTPNPAFLFSSRIHRAALQSMIQSIGSNLGFTVLLGNPGMGKTTLLLQLLSQYRHCARTAFIFQTQCNRHELLRHLAVDLELPDLKRDEVLLHQRLKEMLMNEARAGRKVLIFVDEAQNLHQASLEAIRLLSDFETARAKLLHITLAGSPRLGEILLTPELSQLAQRISTICRLEPLSPEEVYGYVTFRLRVAGCRVAKSLFSSEALAEIAEQSEGVPRVVNSLCYRALYLAYAVGEQHVSGMLARQAVRDLDLSHGPGAANASVASYLPRTEKSDGPGPLVAAAGSEESQRAPKFDISGREAEEQVSKEGMQFRAAAASGGGSSVEQPTPQPPQSSAVSVAHRNPQEFAEARRISQSSAQPRTAARTLRFGLGALHFRLLNDDGFTVALAMLLLILVALGSWAAWDHFYDKPGALVRQTVNTKPVSSENRDWSFLFEVPQASSDAPIPAAISSPTSQRRKLRANAPVVETLPQILVPSRLRKTSEPTGAVAPSNAATIYADGSRLSLTSVPLPVPQLESPVTQPNTDTNTRPNAEANVDAATNVQQTSFPQPIKVVQPEYPKLAKLRHIEGDVLLELQVDSSGNVRNVRTVSGNILLRGAAEEAARQWRYPAIPEDQLSTPALTRVRINFKLNPDAKR